MVSVFCGQLTGTAVGNRLYAEGGWRLSGGVSMAFIGFGLVVCLLRGPWEKRWIGWRGGWNWRRRDLGSNDGEIKGEESPVERVLDDIGRNGRKGRDTGAEKGKKIEKVDGEFLKRLIMKIKAERTKFELRLRLVFMHLSITISMIGDFKHLVYSYAQRSMRQSYALWGVSIWIAIGGESTYHKDGCRF